MGDVAIVSAAGEGIGAAVVEQLVAGGWLVVAIDLSFPDTPSADGVVRIAADATLTASWTDALDIAHTLGRPVRALVSGVGRPVFGSILTLDDDDWATAIEVNLLGTVRATRVVVPEIVASGGGAVVAIGSVNAFLTPGGVAPYDVTKAALVQFVRSAALELAPLHVRVNAVCPGVTDTPQLHRNLALKGQDESDLAERGRRQPRGSMIDPDEVAAAVAFLCSAAGSGVSGAALTVDGALSARISG